MSSTKDYEQGGPTEPSGSRALRQGGGPWRVPLMALLVGAVAVPSMLTRDVWNPDEPRYVEVAREMAVSGDYLIPHLNGQVYSEKPPLWFWATAGLWHLGVGSNSGRVVTLVAVLGTLMLLWSLAKREAGPRTAWLAVLTALTTVFLVQGAKEGVLDPLLMLLVTSSALCGYYAFHRSGKAALLLWCSSYACMALGTLTKGPVGILVPGVVLLAYGLINRTRVRGGGMAHLAGAGVYVLCVGAWVVPAVLSGGHEYARTILITQNLGRAVSSWSHENPVYYYLSEALWRLLPWSLLLPLACYSAFTSWRRDKDNLSLFALLWLIAPIVFFSLMSGKRGRYILPVVPAAGLLCGRHLGARLADPHRFTRTEEWLLRAAIGLVALWGVVLLVAIMAGGVPSARQMAIAQGGRSVAEFLAGLTAWHIAVATCLAAIPVCVAIGALTNPGRSALRLAGALGASVLALSVALDVTAAPFINQVKSGRHFGQEVRLRTPDPAHVYMFGDEYSGMYNLYTGYNRMPVLESERELRETLSEPDTFVIGDSALLEDALTPAELDALTVYRERVGHRQMRLLAGGSPGQLRGRCRSRPKPGSVSTGRKGVQQQCYQ